ncbi:MAG: endo-1,4-beta-xylanase [Pseudomonadota bacterium]
MAHDAVALPSLARAFGDRMLVGAAVTPASMSGAMGNLVRNQFSVLVAENAMKPEHLAPTEPGQYEFAAADKLVDAALAAGIKVRGHTLLWHQQMPKWFFVDGSGKDVSRAELIARIEQYITDVVIHFRGRVYAWDVVNEAFVFDEGSAVTDEAGMRLSKLRTIVGPEYLEIAFRAAAKADPAALLFYNDYETQNPRKVAAIVKAITDLKSKGVKVDGIGHQAHCSLQHPLVSEFESAIDTYAKLGLVQHITELDISINEQLMENKVKEATPALLKRQADRYHALVSLFLRKREQVGAVLFWGVDDASSWLRYWPMPRFEAPLLFDAQMQAKPAFFAVLAAANGGHACGGSLGGSKNSSRNIPC